MSGMSTTRKVLSLEQKLEVCRLVESFGVGLSTISGIYRSRLLLSAFVLHMNISSCCSSRKSMKKASNSALDSALGIDSFVASSGWLRNFKSRRGIRELKIHREKFSADSENAAKLSGTLNDLIRKEGYNVDLEYNADETSLSCKERVTLLCCANAIGSHRLPLLLVGKSKRPRVMIGVQKLPVVYDYQTKLITESY
ncbi:Jerky -like protein-like [Trichinella zimbabwensis]|uniref:Jerky-like protein-like n=1 Tax=Trichinella zimbabwensis TaxID=268475 RepID=A0A0V1H903_9BILA|nr:Jerky -like protein-like [Trichinella zimbabwensis]